MCQGLKLVNYRLLYRKYCFACDEPSVQKLQWLRLVSQRQVPQKYCGTRQLAPSSEQIPKTYEWTLRGQAASAFG